MMHKSGFQTDLLRWFAIFYGYAGFQVYDIHWGHPASVLNVVINIVCTCMVLYTVIVLDPFSLNELAAKYCHGKPLFATIVTFGSEYAQPLSYFISMTYYLLYGPRIVRLLDSDCFQSAFKRSRKSVLVFSTVATLTILSFMAYVVSFVSATNIWRNLFIKTSILFLHLYMYISMNIIYYYQYCTRYRLRVIEWRLAARKVLIIEEDDCLSQIQSLSIANYELNRLMSLPVLIYISGLVYRCVLFFCMSLIDGLDPGLALHILIEVVYFAYLIRFNGQVLHLVEEIFAHFRAKYEPDGDALPLSRNILIRIAQERSSVRADVRRASSRQMRFSALDQLYRDHFSLRLFQTVPLNFSFLSNSALFIMSYVVFITQTN